MKTLTFRTCRLVAVFLLCAVVAGIGPRAYPCASVEPIGGPAEPDVRVSIAEESAIIVWDAANRTEHFIRRATFDTGGRAIKDFGFLVPTPTVPELAEARDTAFDSLEKTMEPEILHKQRFKPALFSILLSNLVKSRGSDTASTAGGAKGAMPAGVEVLHTQQVAGFDAAVLEAKDPAALNGWLKKNGYASRPALTDWLTPYIRQGWKITAFKIAKGEGGQPLVGSGSVRMSFQTDKPFFPYREPSDARNVTTSNRPRLLRVFFLGTERMRGTLAGADWKAAVPWTAPLPKDRQAGLAAPLALTDDKMPASPWMTVFEDRQTPRPGVEDVFFEGAPDQTKILPEPIIVWKDIGIPIPIEFIIIALGWGFVVFIQRRRIMNR
jgi:hypothetical protein